MTSQRLLTLVSAALSGVVSFASSASACSTTTPCLVETGEYNIAKPDADTEAAVIFIHGFGGSGSGVFRNQSLTNSVLERGYALVAPTGLVPEGRNGGSWSFHPNREQRRDEISFIKSVRDDLIETHGIDPDKILLTGFSIGGSMTSYLACAEPDAFKAYAPLGGSFWRPHPTTCAGSVSLLHTHGWTDGTVPLEGRMVRGIDVKDPNSFVQGDVFHAMSIWREANQCNNLKADRFDTSGPFMRRSWERCAPGSNLELAIFPAGHIIPKGWAEMAIEWFENL
ncbi:prolyl oligopeptidase family serine peptidase [Planktotalea sp.]|uniref:alpha/beta hydrolase family esterase n=1 Tax=Planktotalea sp. TaxID=2029877 RepID=UPI0032976B58